MKYLITATVLCAAGPALAHHMEGEVIPAGSPALALGAGVAVLAALLVLSYRSRRGAHR